MFAYGRQCTDQHSLLVAILMGAGGADAERLKPPSWPGRIADVVFEREDWIFEVKSLEVDRPADPMVQSAIGDGLFRDARKFGGPIIYGKVRVPIASLPQNTARNLLRTLGRPVQKAVKEANSQIKATRDALGRQEANGCLALICPPHELSPQVVGWLLADALREGMNTSINSAIIAQTPLLAPFGPRHGSSYVLFPSVQGTSLPMRLKRKIGRKWCAVHGQRYVESTPEAINEMVQTVVKS